MWWIENDLISEWGSELSRFLCEVENGLIFCFGIEIDLVFVSGNRNWLDSRVEVEPDLISSVIGSKSTWILCGESKITFFDCGDRNRRGFLGGRSKLSLFSCEDRN